MTQRDHPADVADEDADALRGIVRDYYGQTLSKTADLKTSACSVADAPDPALAERLSALHPDTLERFFGCGLIAPEALDGRRVLDLGCGAGRDVYVLAQLVGASGFVAGVDMTEAQLDAARSVLDWHMERFGFAEPNVAFHRGLLEKLDAVGLEPASFDVAVSNCVINLVPDKGAALEGVAKLLKEGGEFHFADVYADRRLPDAVRNDPVLYGECLGGALYWPDFVDLARAHGFTAPMVMSGSPVAATDPAMADKLGGARFAAVTARLFKLGGADGRSEDYGQTARYRGGLGVGLDEGAPFALSASLVLEPNTPTPIDRDTARALTISRLNQFFEVTDAGAHAGVFSRADDTLVEKAFAAAGDGAGGCCG